MISIEERLRKAVTSVIAVEEDEFTPRASFVNDFNADSFQLVEIAMNIEDEFNIRIPHDDMPKLTTVQSVLDYVKGKLE